MHTLQPVLNGIFRDSRGHHQNLGRLGILISSTLTGLSHHPELYYILLAYRGSLEKPDPVSFWRRGITGSGFSGCPGNASSQEAYRGSLKKPAFLYVGQSSMFY